MGITKKLLLLNAKIADSLAKDLDEDGASADAAKARAFAANLRRIAQGRRR